MHHLLGKIPVPGKTVKNSSSGVFFFFNTLNDALRGFTAVNNDR